MPVEVAGVPCSLCSVLTLTMVVAGSAYCLDCLDSPTGHALFHLVEGVEIGCETCLAQAVGT